MPLPASASPAGGYLCALTLTEPGEVKVDLANFDLKLQENFISTSHFFLPIPEETSFGAF
jgi:hypothetical protein